MTDKTAEGAYHYSSYRQEYDGYHKCPEGTDRVEGLAPQRCANCTLGRMTQR